MTAVTPKQHAERLVARAAAALGHDSSGQLVFRQPLDFLADELTGIANVVERREVVRHLARFGFVLEKERGAPEASRTFMAVLTRVALSPS